MNTYCIFKGLTHRCKYKSITRVKPLSGYPPEGPSIPSHKDSACGGQYVTM